jgi:hypothetical protein
MPAKTPPVPPVPSPADDANVPPVPPVPPPADDVNVPPQPNPYAAPAVQPNPYAAPVYYTAGPRTNVLAIVSFVASLAAMFLWFAGSLTAIITGHIALNQIKKTNEAGHGFALAGVIIGYVGFGLAAIFVVAYIIFIVVVVSAGASYDSAYSR